MSKLRAAIVAEIDRALGDGSIMRLTHTTCPALAERLKPALGYEPSPTHVSRVLRELGWIKSIENGLVMFTRPSEAGQ